MKNLKTYKYFLESKDSKYSIYEWLEDMKSHLWNKNPTINRTSLKKWSDHFIGEGYFGEINTLVDNIFESFKKVDIHTVNDRMYDIYDELPSGKANQVMFVVLNGDAENFDRPIRRRYNGYSSVSDPNDDNRKIDIIIDILKDITMPTLFIGYPSVDFRTTEEEIYVTDDKYKCENFDINNYSLINKQSQPHGFIVKMGNRLRDTTIQQSDITKKIKYDIDKILDMYKPGIVIRIGNLEGHMTGKMNLRKLESGIDEILPSILPTLDYEEVIFDSSRGDRRFDDDMDVYDYTIKILLK